MKNKKPLLILAPMAGITDLSFRLICKEFGAEMVYSEMISAAGLFYNGSKTKELLKTLPIEQPIAFQLFGSKPEHFIKATQIISEKLKAKSYHFMTLQNQLDINFGCPVKKVIKQGAGCALMEKPKLARKIIRAVLENTILPVSIKIRAGIKNITALDFLKETADLDWKTVIIHGRTYEQGFGGPINYKMIKKIKEKYPQKIVIANGGVFTPEIAKDILEKTGADGLAIGRGALGQPWIFRQIKDYLETGHYQSSSLSETKRAAIKHIKLFSQYKDEKYLPEFRKHLGWYFKNFPGAKNFRGNLMTVKKLKNLRKIIDDIK